MHSSDWKDSTLLPEQYEKISDSFLETQDREDGVRFALARTDWSFMVGKVRVWGEFKVSLR